MSEIKPGQLWREIRHPERFIKVVACVGNKVRVTNTLTTRRATILQSAFTNTYPRYRLVK